MEKKYKSYNVNCDTNKFKLYEKKDGLYIYMNGVRKPIFIYNAELEDFILEQINEFDDDYLVTINGPRFNRNLFIIKVSKDGKVKKWLDKNACDVEKIDYGVYLLNNLDEGQTICYVRTGECLDFSRVYSRETTRNLIEEAPLLVEQKYIYPLNKDITDTITYGIDPITKEVITSIYSKLQNKYFSVPGWVRLDNGFNEIIEDKILKYLYNLGDKTPIENQVLNSNGSVNKEFVMTLGKRRFSDFS